MLEYLIVKNDIFIIIKRFQL